MIVPFPPGGPADVVARILSEQMHNSLGQPIIIENATGASGGIGTGRVARAAADGYTIGFGYWGTHVSNAYVYRLQYVVRDFDPIVRMPGQPLLVVARKGIPASNLAEFVGWLKANPDKASHGTAGVGSAGHLIGAMFQQYTGTKFQFVPYRGTAPATEALLAGDIDFNNPTTTISHIGAGALQAYAVTSAKRLDMAKEIPTVDEAGLPGLKFTMWQGVWAPRGTPKERIAKINAAAILALSDPGNRRKLLNQGFELQEEEELTPEALASLQKAELEKWGPIIKAADIKIE